MGNCPRRTKSRWCRRARRRSLGWTITAWRRRTSLSIVFRSFRKQPLRSWLNCTVKVKIKVKGQAQEVRPAVGQPWRKWTRSIQFYDKRDIVEHIHLLHCNFTVFFKNTIYSVKSLYWYHS